MEFARQVRRQAQVSRKTDETDIEADLLLDGSGSTRIASGVAFFDHMLEQTFRHALFDLELRAQGDLLVDAHHTIEDCGYVLGKAISQALGARVGIARYGSALIPMDESLARVVIDLSGRPSLHFRLPFISRLIGSCDVCLFQVFFSSFSHSLGASLHMTSLYGENDHHRIEGIFKGLGHALRAAVRIDESLGQRVLSTKGCLSGVEGSAASMAEKSK